MFRPIMNRARDNIGQQFLDLDARVNDDEDEANYGASTPIMISHS